MYGYGTTNHKDASELYKTMYRDGIGTECVDFYKQWADHYERLGDVKNLERAAKLLNEVGRCLNW